MVLPKYQKTSAAASPKAEPKKRGRKPTQSPGPATAAVKDRARTASLERPSRKRGKASSVAAEISAANAAAAKRASIEQAVQEAQSVPAPIRDLLCCSLAGCCAVSGDFHPFQERILRMLNKTLKDIQVEKSCNFQGAASHLSRVKEELDRLEKEQDNIEAAVTVSSADAKKKEADLAHSVAVLQPSKLALEKARTHLQGGDAVIGAAAMEIEQLRIVRTQIGHLSQEAALAKLQDICSGWALNSQKLDDITLLEGELCKRLAVLSETVTKAAVVRVSISEEFEAAQTCVDVASEKQKTCAAALAKTESERQERVALLKTKTQALKQQRTVVAQTVRAWHSAQRRLADFQKGPAVAFKDIITEMEERHGISIFDGAKLMEADTAPADTDATIPIENGSLAFCCGAPIIDRRQRQAVLRRRSAALPIHCFSRLSLRSRRSSILGRPRPNVDTNASKEGSGQSPSAKKCGSDSDGDSAMADGRKDMDLDQGGATCRRAFDGSMDIPTPNRSGFAATPLQDISISR